MKRRLSFALLLTLATVASACATDVKGESCGFLDALVDSEGNTYCPDEDAQGDCEDLKAGLVESQAGCGILTEEQIQSAVDDAFDCDRAVATSQSFDKCTDTLDAGFCLDAEGLPEECKGAVLLN